MEKKLKDGRFYICEDYPLIYRDAQIELSESSVTPGTKVFKLKGLFHLAETKNANGRIYSKSLLEREVNRIMPMVKNRQVIGELDHPNDPMPRLQGASCVITELKMKGNEVYGVLEAINTPHGKTLQGLIESGVKLGISSRGVGSLSEDDNGVKVVQEDYQLLTWDVVPNPSTPDAWLSENTRILAPQMDEEYNFVPLNTKNQEISKIKEVKGSLDILDKVDRLFGG